MILSTVCCRAFEKTGAPFSKKARPRLTKQLAAFLYLGK